MHIPSALSASIHELVRRGHCVHSLCAERSQTWAGQA